MVIIQFFFVYLQRSFRQHTDIVCLVNGLSMDGYIFVMGHERKNTGNTLLVVRYKAFEVD